MRKITSREEANLYYKKINEVIDEYIKNWKIKPTEIYHYVNRNIKSFLEEIGLEDVEGIQTVVNDVLSHKKNVELDSVLTFESFNSLATEESLMYEKVIADYFNVGLGHIDLVDFELRLYRVKDFGERKFVSLYNSKDLLDLKERLVSEIITSTKSKSISLPLYSFDHTFKFWLFDVLDTDLFSKSLSDRLNEELVSILRNMVLSSGLVPNLQKEITVDKSGDFTILIF